jgi:hypothetical protein
VSQPDQARPVPGPPRVLGVPPAEPGVDASQALAGLADRPVAEHVAVFEAEHDRLRRELSTIDQL